MKFPVHVLISTVVGLVSSPAQSDEIDDLAVLPCDTATIDYNSLQRWELGSSPYGIAFETWTAETFNTLRGRILECANRDAQSFFRYISYLEDTTMEARAQAVSDLQKKAAAAEEERKAAAFRAERALQAQIAADEARKREAAQETQPSLDTGANSEIDVDSEKQLPEVQRPRDADVDLFVRNNPTFPAPSPKPADASLQELQAIIANGEIYLLALQLCNERWDDFAGYEEEVRRRVDLIRRLYMQVYNVPPETVADFHEKAIAAVTGNTQATDMFLANLDELYLTCQQSILNVSYGLNFAK